jgi:hypothetical protein
MAIVLHFKYFHITAAMLPYEMSYYIYNSDEDNAVIIFVWQSFPASYFQTAKICVSAWLLPQPEQIHKSNFTDHVALSRNMLQRYVIQSR